MRVMEPFQRWLDEQELGGLADAAGAVLTARRDYGGRTDPTWWRSGDVHDLMALVVPARMTDAARISEHGVAGLDAFLDFLDGTGRLHPSSMHVKALKNELARVAGEFEAAMADRSRWRLAKTLYEAMRAEDVPRATTRANSRRTFPPPRRAARPAATVNTPAASASSATTVIPARSSSTGPTCPTTEAAACGETSPLATASTPATGR